MLLNPAGAQDNLSDNCGKLVERLAEFDGTIELNNQPQDAFALQKLAEANRDEECKVVIDQMKVEANQADSSQAQSGESQSDSMKASGADGNSGSQDKQSAQSDPKSGGANAGSKPDQSDQKMSGSSEGTGKSGKAHNSDTAKGGHADKANQADSKMSAASGKADQSDQQMSQAGDGSKQSGNRMSGSSDQSGGKMSDAGKSSESSGQEMSEADNRGAQSGQQSSGAEKKMRDRITAQDGDGDLNEGTNQSVTVGAMEGQKVVNASGQELGEIERVVRMDGQEYVVVQHGGFLRIGDSETAVPLDRLTRRGDQFVLRAMTEEELDRMPEFDAGDGQDVRNSEEVQLNVQS
jgi:hypothetical protein